MTKHQNPWTLFPSFEEANLSWEEQSKGAASIRPLKSIRKLPQMPGITKKTAKYLKWKSLYWMVTRDKGLKIFKAFMHHPIRYTIKLAKSLSKKKSYVAREEDFFFYNLASIEAFKKKAQNPNSLVVLGFSYCHKPFECPSVRFSSDCIHDLTNPVCQQCFIGKSIHAAKSKRVLPVIIPTVHHIGNSIFEVMQKHPKKEIFFLITACEMTLNMFGDFGNMISTKTKEGLKGGLGVRLDGRICNTMNAFKLSEEGIKPGLTVVLPNTQEKILRLIHAID